MIVQLVYISKPVTPVLSTVVEFVPIAQEKNVEFEVTGMVISSDDFYLQLLEGPRTAINQLYSNISKDPRHAQIVLLRYSEVRIKEFEQWSMAHTTLVELRKVALNGVTLPDIITPKNLSSVQALAILRRTAALLKVQQVDIEKFS